MTPSLTSRYFPSSVHRYLLILSSIGSLLNLIWATPRFLSRANKWWKLAILTPSYSMWSFSLYSIHFLFPKQNTENAELTHSWKLVSVLSPVLKEWKVEERPIRAVALGPGRRGRTTAPQHLPQASRQSRMDNTHPRTSWRMTTWVAGNAKAIRGNTPLFSPFWVPEI